MTNAAKYAVQLGDSLLGTGIGDEAAWTTDSVHATEAAAIGAADARRAQRTPDSSLLYRVVRIDCDAPYAQVVAQRAS